MSTAQVEHLIMGRVLIRSMLMVYPDLDANGRSHGNSRLADCCRIVHVQRLIVRKGSLDVVTWREREVLGDP
jgi:hypothetical protein